MNPVPEFSCFPRVQLNVLCVLRTFHFVSFSFKHFIFRLFSSFTFSSFICCVSLPWPHFPFGIDGNLLHRPLGSYQEELTLLKRKTLLSSNCFFQPLVGLHMGKFGGGGRERIHLSWFSAELPQKGRQRTFPLTRWVIRWATSRHF